MTEQTTPTGDNDQDSSGITNEPLLEQENIEQSTAVEESNDTDQSESSDSASDTSSTTEESSDDNSEEDITAFAKSQGIDLDKATETEKKLLAQLKKNSREARQEVEAKNGKKFDKTIDDLSPTKDAQGADAKVAILEARLAAKDAKDAFWAENPDDRQYESKMSELLTEEKEKYGADAAWQLAQNLPRLLREAKFASGAYDSDAARDAGRREEREALRKKQEGGSDSAHATSQAPAAGKVDREWIENEYDPSNPEHQRALDEAMASGSLY